MSAVLRSALLWVLMLPLCAYAAPDPLPSWREGGARAAILNFIERTTTAGSPDFVAPLDRVAVFEHDGTLWPAQPLPAQLRFLVEKVRASAGERPEWYRREPYKTVLEGKEAAIAELGEREWMQMQMAVHSGISNEDYQSQVVRWLGEARHPRFQRPYSALVYAPMRELVALLERSGYRCFILTSGDAEFLRSHVETVYGLPSERVIGSQQKTAYQLQDGRPVLVRQSLVHMVDGRGRKAGVVQQYLGRRPRLVAGAADGDDALPAWVSAGPGPRLVLRLRHDDAEREYDQSGGDDAVADATANSWRTVSIKQDWRQVFAGEGAPAVASPR